MINDVLIARLRMKGITLKTIAADLGVSYSYIVKVARGLRSSKAVKSGIASALDATVEELWPEVDEIEEVPAGPPVPFIMSIPCSNEQLRIKMKERWNGAAGDDASDGPVIGAFGRAGEADEAEPADQAMHTALPGGPPPSDDLDVHEKVARQLLMVRKLDVPEASEDEPVECKSEGSPKILISLTLMGVPHAAT